MDLTESEYEGIRTELAASQKPFFLFHDDPDGLVSFLLLKRYIGRGKGMMVKAEPNVNGRFVGPVVRANPDALFVLDVALMQQSFVDEVRRSLPGLKSIVWIDHHQPVKLNGVRYFNPRLHAPQNNPPASYLCYKAAGQAGKQDLWLAMAGIVSDWHMPEFADEFTRKFPDLLPKPMTAEEALFTTLLGKLGRIFSFMLKGPTSDAVSCINALERVSSPYEILNRTTTEGRHIYRHFRKISSQYDRLLAEAKTVAEGSKGEKFLIFTYKDRQSLSGDLANELLFLYPNRVIVVGREKADSFMLSFRARLVPVLPALQKALVGIDGYGGGHEKACGGSVRKKDFEKFIEKFKGEF
ncbi:DHH family phosphoesterase [Candidatus Woesearchaeota archaeon]|nr:DHH family phosphoesterase [Candidatus Woesearchaeota archaeon]